ncbi:glycoside hydrolase family 2 TIM barrel-domain containing protein [Carboxylicivirga sp. M1479]|uniref:glycoside hydrolase family 2 TIM barrel-domain containing protein n=1 Tax=Carboxylicivirga sp. M1479 TaxID=2594476 RepID=UPI00117804D5|nr:glycoside hydrolase family 2 TIM barrel-domain containing protein [Carboxylicivirga sp. M1479]TRX66068.1 hypothetical protein FNN09_15345 [Carboxylicivirga sp. M1479]
MRILFILTLVLIGQQSIFCQKQRQEISLNSNWQFVKSDISIDSLSQAKLNWERIQIPHTYNSKDAFDDQEGYYRGKTWYRRDVKLSESQLKKNLYLYFEGVNQEAIVYVNGKLAGKHEGGYTRFCFDITDLVEKKVNGKADCEILVQVDNRFNENIPTLTADFTFYGGIYRDVYLISTHKTHFSLSDYASNGIYISTPKVSKQKADIEIKGLITSDKTLKDVLVTNILKDKNGDVVLEETKKVKLNGKHEIEFNLNNSLNNPRLWSIDNPYLYTLHSVLSDPVSKKELDYVTNPVGFRWFTFSADKGFFLNGIQTKLIGVNRHQDYKGLGNALPDYLHLTDIAKIKEMGGNVLRIAHYPQDPVVLEMCDKLGIIATVEIPMCNRITESEAFYSNSLTMMEEMIKQNYNHPSVVIWAYMNEILLRPKYEDNKERQKEYFKNINLLAQRIENKTRALDPYRYTMIPNHGAFDRYVEVGLTEIPMIVGWNLYQGWYGGKFSQFGEYLDRHHRELPHKPMLVTEYGAGADPRLHTFNPVAFDFSVEYATNYHRAYLKAIKERNFVAGAMVWNQFDFGSEGRGDAVPHMNNKGLSTFNRKPKEPYYLYKVSNSSEPIVVISSKNWNNRSAVSDSINNSVATQEIILMSNMSEVQLELNGRLLGTKKVRNNEARFNVPFINGENILVAKAKTDSAVVMDVANIKFEVLPFHTSNVDFNYIAINAGSHQYFSDNVIQQNWVPDKPYSVGSWGYIGGKTFKVKTWHGTNPTASENIIGTKNDPIYQSQRVNPKAYKFDLPAGEYIVELHFSELLKKEEIKKLAYNLGNDAIKVEVEEREFSVKINETTVIENLNLAQDFCEFVPFVLKNKIIIEGGEGITIRFNASKGVPVINALSIRKVTN